MLSLLLVDAASLSSVFRSRHLCLDAAFRRRWPGLRLALPLLLLHVTGIAHAFPRLGVVCPNLPQVARGCRQFRISPLETLSALTTALTSGGRLTGQAEDLLMIADSSRRCRWLYDALCKLWCECAVEFLFVVGDSWVSCGSHAVKYRQVFWNYVHLRAR
ncbi:hypothetical protein MTO96_004403 [Rhipicephalus appendiculatus]